MNSVVNLYTSKGVNKLNALQELVRDFIVEMNEVDQFSRAFLGRLIQMDIPRGLPEQTNSNTQNYPIWTPILL